MPCTEILKRWFEDQTPLSCVAEIRPGPAVIRMPSCHLTLADEPMLTSDTASAVLLPPWEEASVETDWRGTKIELTWSGGTVVIADYDCVGELKEVLSH
jgi:hypothetical protein